MSTNGRHISTLTGPIRVDIGNWLSEHQELLQGKPMKDIIAAVEEQFDKKVTRGNLEKVFRDWRITYTPPRAEPRGAALLWSKLSGQEQRIEELNNQLASLDARLANTEASLDALLNKLGER